MAGIYIHIPFCKKACHYCNFHFSTQTHQKEEFIQSLISEIELQKNYLHQPIETIYLGGGTPSLLDNNELELIIQSIQKHFTLAPQIECTLEANPDDMSAKAAQTWRSLGVNRLSLGIQSFQPQALAWMNRAHTVEQSHQAIQIAIEAGFTNISADIIYGTPHLSDKDLNADIQQLLNYSINHISAYALTVEEKTALFSMIEKNKMDPVNTEQQARQFDMVVNALEAAGLEHYEISNFSKPGFKSKHNSHYWNQTPYLGLGPSAHSYNGHQRQWNVSNNALYIQSIKNDLVPFELENLDLSKKFNEYMMLSLRKSEGFSIAYIQSVFGEAYWQHCKSILPKYINQAYVYATPNGYALTKKAKFFADGIASDFFWIEN